ncbi:MAG: hypothetical protein R3C18_02835 [Planctomycetaceae bacterium]
MNEIRLRGVLPVGDVLVTRGARSKLKQDDMFRSLVRHMTGDWGDVNQNDWKENNAALESGFRILSKYSSLSGVKFWIITVWDRSETTILLPEEYAKETGSTRG